MVEPKRNRHLGLDILRGTAVLLVMFRHLPVPPDHFLFQSLLRGGWIGVDLFFVLSGFLVSGLLYKEFIQTQKTDLLHFLIRRGFKIYPSLYFIVFVFTLLSTVYQKIELRPILCELFFVANYCNGFWVAPGAWLLKSIFTFYLLSWSSC